MRKWIGMLESSFEMLPCGEKESERAAPASSSSSSSSSDTDKSTKSSDVVSHVSNDDLGEPAARQPNLLEARLEEVARRQRQDGTHYSGPHLLTFRKATAGVGKKAAWQATCECLGHAVVEDGRLKRCTRSRAHNSIVAAMRPQLMLGMCCESYDHGSFGGLRLTAELHTWPWIIQL